MNITTLVRVTQFYDEVQAQGFYFVLFTTFTFFKSQLMNLSFFVQS